MYRRIVFIVLGLVVIGGFLVSHLLYSVVAEKRSFEAQAREWALSRTAITQIDEVYEYRGSTTSAVVIGKNQQGTSAIAWLTKDTLTYDTMDGKLTKENVSQSAAKHFPAQEVVRIVPGIENKKPFWEAVLKDPNGDYSYLYYDFYTGQMTKSFTIHSSVKA